MGARPWEEAAIIQNREIRATEAIHQTEDAADREEGATVTQDQAPGRTATVTTTATMTDDHTTRDDQKEAKEVVVTPAKVERAIDRDRT